MIKELTIFKQEIMIGYLDALRAIANQAGIRNLSDFATQESGQFRAEVEHALGEDRIGPDAPRIWTTHRLMALQYWYGVQTEQLKRDEDLVRHISKELKMEYAELRRLNRFPWFLIPKYRRRADALSLDLQLSEDSFYDRWEPQPRKTRAICDSIKQEQIRIISKFYPHGHDSDRVFDWFYAWDEKRNGLLETARIRYLDVITAWKANIEYDMRRGVFCHLPRLLEKESA